MITLGRTPRDDYIEDVMEKHAYIINNVLKKLKVPYRFREDAYQVCRIAMWKCIENYDPSVWESIEDENVEEEAVFCGYVYRACYNAALDYVMKEHDHAIHEFPMSELDMEYFRPNEWIKERRRNNKW